MIWLIQGHLTKEDALKMVEATEGALTFRRISEDDIQCSRCIKFKDKTVYNLEQDNVSKDNPNSVCKAIFQDEVEADKDAHAASTIMMSLLKEPIFNTLRT